MSLTIYAVRCHKNLQGIIIGAVVYINVEQDVALTAATRMCKYLGCDFTLVCGLSFFFEQLEIYIYIYRCRLTITRSQV